MNAQDDLIEFLTANDIVPVAYSPIGRYNSTRLPSFSLLEHDKEGLLEKLAQKYDKTLFQIVLNWGLMRGYVVIPKASSLKHQQTNWESKNFQMDKEDIELITKTFDCGHRIFKSMTGKYNIFA